MGIYFQVKILFPFENVLPGDIAFPKGLHIKEAVA
jgi:hypothetical protein